MTETLQDLGAEMVSAGPCPGCKEIVQYVHGNYTASGEHENWRLGLEGQDHGDCIECRERPA